MPPELRADAFSGTRAINAAVLTAERQITEIMADEAVRFRIDVNGRLFARMADNPDEMEYALAASVEDLRYKLAEWAKVVEANGKVGDLIVRVKNGFVKADLACLKRVRDENKRLGRVLPKRRPRTFIDCMRDVLKQNAVATFSRVDKELIPLHKMA